MRKLARIVGLVTIAGLTLSACGAGSSTTSESATALSAINKQPRSNLKEGGTLLLPINSIPVNWNQLQVDGNDSSLALQIYFWSAPNFWDVSADGELSPRKAFMLDAKSEGGKDGKPQVVTVTLNPKAKWNNGKPITWEDFKAEWEACNGKNKDFQCSSTSGYDQITNVEKGKDEFQYKITFKSAYPDWQGIIGIYSPKESLATPEVFNKGWLNFHNEWLAGPYKIQSVETKGANPKVVMVPNEKWWGEKPLLNKIVYTLYQDFNTAVTAYLGKQLDVVTDLITADQYQKAKGRQDGKVKYTPSYQWRQVTINSSVKPLNDLKVRQAFEYALDRTAITKALQAGLPGVDQRPTLGNHFQMPGQKGYEDNGVKYDPKKAKELLEEAGWKLPEGGKVRMKDGQKLTVKLVDFGSDIATTQKENQLIQKFLGDVGFDAQLDAKDPSKFSNILSNGEFGTINFTWVGNIYPYGGAKQIYGCKSESNYSNLCNDEAEKLLEKVDTTVDPEERIKYGNELDKVLWKDVWNVPLYQRDTIWAVKNGIANYGPALSEIPHPEDVGYMKESK